MIVLLTSSEFISYNYKPNLAQDVLGTLEEIRNDGGIVELEPIGPWDRPEGLEERLEHIITTQAKYLDLATGQF